MPIGLAGAAGAAGKGALTPAIRHSKLGRPSGGGGKSPKKRNIAWAIVAVVLIVSIIAGGYVAILQGLFGVLNGDDTPAGTFTTITLYVQATDSANNPIKDVTVDLKPTKKNTTGSELNMPATGDDGIASMVLGSSGGAFDAPTNGKSYYFSCSAYNPTRKQGAHPKPECAGVTGGDSSLTCQPGIIAADPFLIPHGTIVFIQGVDSKTLQPNGFVYGYAEAADTGSFLTKPYNNSGTSSAAKGPSFLGKPAQGVHDVYNKKTYKRAIDMWYNTVTEARKTGTKLCKVTIVSATKPGCMNGSVYIGGVSSGNGAYERQATLARLTQARGGVTTDDSGGVTASYGEYTVTCTGNLTCGDTEADKALDVDSLVQSPGTKAEIQVPGGTLTFWVEIVTDDGGAVPGSIANPPNLDNKGYSSALNPFAHYQCTWYCWGRIYETTGKAARFTVNSGRNGCHWYEKLVGQKLGQNPRPGAIMCLKDGNGSGSGEPGHVAFVEKVSGGGSSITISEGGNTYWNNGKRPNVQTIKRKNGTYPYKGKTCQGFVMPS